MCSVTFTNAMVWYWVFLFESGQIPSCRQEALCLSYLKQARVDAGTSVSACLQYGFRCVPCFVPLLGLSNFISDLISKRNTQYQDSQESAIEFVWATARQDKTFSVTPILSEKTKGKELKKPLASEASGTVIGYQLHLATVSRPSRQFLL
jgi:hypothetical protein